MKMSSVPVGSVYFSAHVLHSNKEVSVLQLELREREGLTMTPEAAGRSRRARSAGSS